MYLDNNLSRGEENMNNVNLSHGLNCVKVMIRVCKKKMNYPKLNMAQYLVISDSVSGFVNKSAGFSGPGT